MSLLELRSIVHGYRRFPGRRVPSLQGVDLSVEAGECWGLIGPNGSGKSSLLRIAAGLATPSAGEVRIAGAPAGSRSARRAVGYAPENLRWPARLSVAAVLAELAAVSAAPQSTARLERAAELCGLTPLLGRRLGTLSFGQSRRVVLAQALLDEPALLLLDEPFSGLDSLVLHDLREELLRRRAAGVALVIASHRVEELAGLCTHALVLREGRVLRSGPAAEVLPQALGRAELLALLGAS
ncbi:MAG: ATP-binding cassette domain-containing protein [Planctomycetota bacterium]